jgi:hypothetical protein
LRFTLPADAAGRRGLLAIRVFMLPRPAPGADGGGMHSAPMLAARPIGDALHRVQWERTVAGYIADAIEPLAMFAVIALAFWCRPDSSRKGFIVFAAVALALTAARRLNNAIVAWTDLQSLTTYSWLASWMWIPTVAAWTMAWNRWCLPPWRGIDAAAVIVAAAEIIGAVIHSSGVTSISRLASIALFVVIVARIVRHGPMRILSLVTLVSIITAFFGAELLDPIGVPGIWFPFGIGVSRTQYIYALAIPLLAILIVRTAPNRSPR